MTCENCSDKKYFLSEENCVLSLTKKIKTQLPLLFLSFFFVPSKKKIQKSTIYKCAVRKGKKN